MCISLLELVIEKLKSRETGKPRKWTWKLYVENERKLVSRNCKMKRRNGVIITDGPHNGCDFSFTFNNPKLQKLQLTSYFCLSNYTSKQQDEPLRSLLSLSLITPCVPLLLLLMCPHRRCNDAPLNQLPVASAIPSARAVSPRSSSLSRLSYLFSVHCTLCHQPPCKDCWG